MRRDIWRIYSQVVDESAHFRAGIGKQIDGIAASGSRKVAILEMSAPCFVPAPGTGHLGGGPEGGSRGGGIGGRGAGLDPGGGSRGASFGGLGIRAMRCSFDVAGLSR